MIGDSRIEKVLYGGDYNPEQWPEEIILFPDYSARKTSQIVFCYMHRILL